MHLNSSYNMDGCCGGRNEQIEQNFLLKLTYLQYFTFSTSTIVSI